MLTSARDRANLDSDFSQKGWCHFETSARSSDDARPRQEGAIEPQMQTPARSCDGAMSRPQPVGAIVPCRPQQEVAIEPKIQTSARSCDRAMLIHTSARSSNGARPQEFAIEPKVQTSARSSDGAMSTPRPDNTMVPCRLRLQPQVAMVPSRDLGKEVRWCHVDSDLSKGASGPI